MADHEHSVLVVGGGPAGLSCAFELVRAGLSPLVLERTQAVGDVWRNHYDGLRLNTGRWFSGLPGLRFPWAAGRWPSRDDLAKELAALPARGGFNVLTGCEVVSVQYLAARGLWQVRCRDDRVFSASALVVATGTSCVPSIPQWPGAQQFTGQIVHAAHFGNARRYAGKHVVVVGSGNSSCEIASRLVPHAASVTLSVRRAPHFLPKSLFGVPLAALGTLIRRLPTRWSDAVLSGLSRRWVGDLSAYGLPPPAQGVSGLGSVTPTLFMPVIDDLKQGRIKVVGPLLELNEKGAVAYTGLDRTQRSTLNLDVIVAGTGYTTGLESLIHYPEPITADGKPMVDANGQSTVANGLFFIGYRNPISGQLREIGLQAPGVAAGIKRYLEPQLKPVVAAEN
ncbi:NAD(P)/FAD-dependent oxidoreductase [Pseudomonas sp. 7P_10.2_Bac1]|uniref:flavin-containing monooxygenase n=1 Tax=Pseudomonas sp. 7P_10.2_Bac1 TaxID=2971614 RepID=UPI0021C766D9|nr:NAD(P)/FAD-dependent oxidoreductase [Pseudomonas sp. 7P_10.2_Bac1]MCU1727819.1 NAD(P)/FAD-dependent oxidoreductase [Pseudomonas sp. 7P_10.2_Bac1]